MSSEKIWVSHLNPNPVFGQNLFFYWGNDLFSFQQFNDLQQPFDFIMVDYMDLDLIQKSFGNPEKKIQCLGRQIWAYPIPNNIFKGLMGSSAILFERELRVKKETFIPSNIFNIDQKNQVMNGFSMRIDTGKYFVEIKTQFGGLDPLLRPELQLKSSDPVLIEQKEIISESSQSAYEIKVESALNIEFTIIARNTETTILGVYLKRIGK